MRSSQRDRFQGVLTIVRFNWHLYVIAIIVVVLLLTIAGLLPQPLTILIQLAACGIMLLLVVSLLASYLAYDASSLYKLEWLRPYVSDAKFGANIHAGFDETSCLLRGFYPEVSWSVYDFYDPKKHTEISIKRARKAYPAVSDTVSHTTEYFPCENKRFDIILLTLAAHEIRDTEERVVYFRELSRSLNVGGEIIVTEHLRDKANMIAYNLGSLHFHSPSEWLSTFREAGLSVSGIMKPAPLITTFILIAHGETH
ncbi:MAG: methyltransferase [Bacteroidota bacterium]